jgi:hypothetical protein
VARQEDVVGVAEGDQLALRLGDAAVARGRDARVLLENDAHGLRKRRAIAPVASREPSSTTTTSRSR